MSARSGRIVRDILSGNQAVANHAWRVVTCDGEAIFTAPVYPCCALDIRCREGRLRSIRVRLLIGEIVNGVAQRLAKSLNISM